jgi:hypothetical protein
MKNRNKIGKYYRLRSDNICRVDNYRYFQRQLVFSGYILSITTGIISRREDLAVEDFVEEISIAEHDAIIDQLSVQCGLSFCF